MLGTGSVHLEPVVDASLVVNTETGKPRDRVSLVHVLQTDDALALLLLKDVLIVADPRLR